MAESEENIGKWNTPLSEEESPKYAAFEKAYADKTGRKPKMERQTYDSQGWWKGGAVVRNPETGGQISLRDVSPDQWPTRLGHGPDTWKKPSHMTFSRESKYSEGGQQGGRWGKNKFVISPTILQHWTPEELQDYFTKYEPEVKLVLPLRLRRQFAARKALEKAE